MAARVLDPIDCSVQPLDISFHPTKNILAAALVDGTLELHDFSIRCVKKKTSSSTHAKLNHDQMSDEEEDTILSSIAIHSPQSNIKCRSILFNNQGNLLFLGGSDGTLTCIDTERAISAGFDDESSSNAILWNIPNASPNGLHTLYQLPDHAPAGPLLVTGDEEGVVRLWDIDQLCGNTTTLISKKTPFDELMKLPRGCISSFREHDDYITGFEIDESCSTLLASSADGTITVYDIRKGSSVPTATSQSSNDYFNNKQLNNIEPKKDWGPFACIRKSDDQEDELLSICKIKGGRKVICGTQLGVLAVFSWGTWGDISDRFPGHPQSIDALLKVDEDTLLTGSSDGIVRIVQIHPDKLLGILGNHGGFPVEKLKFSAGRKVVGSLSHDNLVRLFDASMLNDDDDSDDDDDEDIDEASQMGMDVSEVVDKVTKSVQNDNSDDDWEDMEDESSDSDESMDDSDDDSDDNKGKKPRKFKFKSDNEAFFEDL